MSFYQFATNNCTDTLSATASNLPPGVTMNFSNNQAVISGIGMFLMSNQACLGLMKSFNNYGMGTASMAAIFRHLFNKQ